MTATAITERVAYLSTLISITKVYPVFFIKRKAPQTVDSMEPRVCRADYIIRSEVDYGAAAISVKLVGDNLAASPSTL